MRTPGLAHPWLLLHEALGETQESAFFNKCLEAFSCQMGGTVEALVPEPRAGGRGVAGQRPWRPVAVSGVEHSLPAAVRRTLLETLGWLGWRRVWRACVCARACVHARVHLPAPVSALLLSRFSENSSVHD